MRLKNSMTGWMAAVVLSVATIMTAPCLAQRSNLQHNNFRPVQGLYGVQNRPPGQGHAGDWLRHYQGLPPGERERALQNDPGFRRLSPERQQLLRQRLQHFSSLPPQAAAAHAEPHGDLGASDARARRKRRGNCSGRMQQLPPRPSAYGDHRDP